MKFKLLNEKAYKIVKKNTKEKPTRVVPTTKVSVTDCDTGEVVENCDMDITRGRVIDCTPFTKVFRPNLFDQLKVSEVKLFCYIMEKMNRFNMVHLGGTDPELYEYTGYKCREELYRALAGLREMSVITGKGSVGSGNWKVCEDCLQRKENDKRDQDKRMFVKIYEPRKLLGLSDVALSLFSYICVKMDFEGCVRINSSEFQEMTGYKKARFSKVNGDKYKRCSNQLHLAKTELKEKDFIRDVATMVDDETRKEIGRGHWYAVNPNIFIKGKRCDLGYEVE